MASEVPEPEAGSGKEDEDLELDLSAGLLVLEDGSANSNYQVFSFRSDLGPGDHHDVPIILITRIDTKILVAIPCSFWHRLTRQRLLPSAAFSKAVSVAVAAVEDSHREVAVDNVFIKVWIGLLTPRFEVCIEAASEETALGFHTEDQEEGFVPMAQALLAVADEKFAFLTAESASAIQAETELKDRLAALEAGMMNIQDTLKTLGQPKAAPNAVAATLPPKPKSAIRVGGLEDGDGIAGLDPGAVKAALQSGIDRAQLEEKFMEQALAAWQECEPVTSEAMGRSAGKVEDIESALGRLASLEYAVDDSLNEFLPEASGTSIASLSVLSSLLVCKSSQQEWLGISREFPRWLPRSLFPIGPISKVSRASILPLSWTTLAVGFFNVPLIMHSDLVRLQRIPPESEFLVQMKKFRSYWRSLTSQADLGPFGNVMF